MTFSDGMNFGFLFVPALAILAFLFQLPSQFMERKEEEKAISLDDKAAIIYRRKAEYFRQQKHSNPSYAAHMEIEGTIEVARFRAFACHQYVSNGKNFEDARKEWWKDASKRMMDIQSIGRSKSDATLYVRSVQDFIFNQTPKSTYIDGPAATKWKNECQKITDWNAEHDRQLRSKRDLISETVMAGHWKNLHNAA